MFESFARAIGRLEDQVEAVALGARASEYTWFRRRVRRPLQTFGGEWLPNANEPALSPEEFARALDFVTTTALHWQQFPEPPQLEEPEANWIEEEAE